MPKKYQDDETTTPLGLSVPSETPPENLVTEVPLPEPIADVVPEAALFTLAQLAKQHGHALNTPVAGDNGFDALHAVASVAHQWEKHERETGVPLTMSVENYLAAIEAAKEGKTHDPVNHRPAKVKAK